MKKIKGSSKKTNVNALKAEHQLRLMSASQFVAKTIPARKRHWGNRIQANQLGMVYGPRGEGKSWIAIALAVSMSACVSFLGHKPKKPRRVIYLDGEMDAMTVKQRLEQIAASMKAKLGTNLRVFTPEMFSGLLPAINSTDGQEQIAKAIGNDWDVLIVDNYSAWSGSGSETSEAWAPFLRWLLPFKHAGKSVIIVHHTNKTGGQRGSSRHEDALDWSIALKPRKDFEPPVALCMTLEWVKARNLTPEQAKSITVKLVRAETADKETAEKQVAIEWQYTFGSVVESRTAEMLKLRKEGKYHAEIAEAVGIDRSVVSRALKGVPRGKKGAPSGKKGHRA